MISFEEFWGGELIAESTALEFPSGNGENYQAKVCDPVQNTNEWKYVELL